MYRTELDFLDPMFALVGGTQYPVLVINQTDSERLLESSVPHIRVINSFERGLSHSRNLAIAECKGDICLVADDDVVYLPGFDQVVSTAHEGFNDAGVVTFEMQDNQGNPFRSYPQQTRHDKHSVKSVNGVVISFKRQVLLESGVRYNPHFGLGCTFGTANEYVFMRNVLASGLLACFEAQPILRHPDVSSGRDQGSDRVVFGRAALQYKYSGIWSYLWVIKYVRFLIAHKYISTGEWRAKLKAGYRGIQAYKALLRSGQETR